MKGKRIFAAIDIPDDARSWVAAYIAGLQREFGHLRIGWEHGEKLHITIKFAGYLEDAELLSFITKAEMAAETCPPFDITLAGTGAFIKRKGSNVLWLRLDAEPFAGIAGKFNTARENENERPKRPFNPHLTIARLKEPRKSAELIDRHLASNFAPVVFQGTKLVVYESKLLPTGSLYTAISKHLFRRPTE